MGGFHDQLRPAAGGAHRGSNRSVVWATFLIAVVGNVLISSAAAAAGWTQKAELTASDGVVNDYFGVATALSTDGKTAVVGTPQLQSFSAPGKAYVFTRRSTLWIQVAELTASDGAAAAEFGSNLALSGDAKTVVIGAEGRSSGSGGAAYVFNRRGNAWIQTAELTARDGDIFPSSLALSYDGETAAIGSLSRNSFTGATYVFTLIGHTWRQKAELKAKHGASGDVFGSSVALSTDGETAAIGAAGRNASAGAAYVFQRSGSIWYQAAELTAKDLGAGDDFGAQVSISGGNTILVGASQFDSVGAGKAYVFARSGPHWAEQAELTASDGVAGDLFGTSVAVSTDGKTALVGANQLGGEPTGKAYVFYRLGKTWNQSAELLASDGIAPDLFGSSVSLGDGGRMALVGAFGRNSATGAAYVFSY